MVRIHLSLSVFSFWRWKMASYFCRQRHCQGRRGLSSTGSVAPPILIFCREPITYTCVRWLGHSMVMVCVVNSPPWSAPCGNLALTNVREVPQQHCRLGPRWSNGHDRVFLAHSVKEPVLNILALAHCTCTRASRLIFNWLIVGHVWNVFFSLQRPVRRGYLLNKKRRVRTSLYNSWLLSADSLAK